MEEKDIYPLLDIAALIAKRDRLNETEQQALNSWRAASEQNEMLYAELTSEQFAAEATGELEAYPLQQAFERVYQETGLQARIIRLPFLRRTSIRIAIAAVTLFVIMTTAYFFLQEMSVTTPGIVQTNKRLPDVAPGGNKAILTLAGGKQMVLDNAANGTIANEGSATVTKLADGQLAYEANNITKDITENSLSTPRGGQYQLTLPDGTKVWLNAASAITYPTAFTGNERKVKASGEVYFEVAKNKTMPFIVQVNEHTKIQVLGTHFNINAYPDEPALNTTLLEGSVQVNYDNTVKVIRPGEQAQIKGAQLRVQEVNTSDVVAWVKGQISLEQADIKTIMRQLSRWYDVDVQYEGTMPSQVFVGRIDRNVQLSSILHVLEKSGFTIRRDGRVITVSAK